MGKVSSLAEPGLELFFNSSDHLPPHFHAEKPGEWEVRVFFLRVVADMVELKWALRAPSARVLKKLCAAAEQRRAALLVEWELKVFVGTPGEEQ